MPSKEYYNDSSLVAKYSQAIEGVLENLLHEAKGFSEDLNADFDTLITRSAELVDEVVGFETVLAEATPATEDSEDVTQYYNPRTLDQATDLLPQLSIPAIMARFAPSGCKPKKLIVGSPSYLKAVSKALNGISDEVLLAYFVWKTVQAYAYKIESDSVRPLKRFNNELQGKDPDAVEERWRTCIKNSDNSLGRQIVILFRSQI